MPKLRKDTSKGPDPTSIRSKRRANRGFKSIEISTRKGRRNSSRISIKCNINGTIYVAGTKMPDKSSPKMSSFMQTAGGGNDFH